MLRVFFFFFVLIFSFSYLRLAVTMASFLHVSLPCVCWQLGTKRSGTKQYAANCSWAPLAGEARASPTTLTLISASHTPEHSPSWGLKLDSAASCYVLFNILTVRRLTRVSSRAGNLGRRCWGGLCALDPSGMGSGARLPQQRSGLPLSALPTLLCVSAALALARGSMETLHLPVMEMEPLNKILD